MSDFSLPNVEVIVNDDGTHLEAYRAHVIEGEPRTCVVRKASVPFVDGDLSHENFFSRLPIEQMREFFPEHAIEVVGSWQEDAKRIVAERNMPLTETVEEDLAVLSPSEQSEETGDSEETEESDEDGEEAEESEEA